MGGEGRPDTSPKEPAKYKQISLGLHGGPPSEKSSTELGHSFNEEGDEFRKGLEGAKNKGPLGQFAAKRIEKLFPHRFKEEGVYFLGDKYSVLVIARWKEGGEWRQAPLIWKVEIKGKVFSLKRTPHPSFDFGKRLSPKNLEKVEDLARSFIEGLLKEGKRPVGGETKRMEIILEPQEESSGDREGEETLDPRTEQPEPSYINPLKDNDENLYKKIMIVDGRNPREKRIIFPLKEGEVIFVFKWTGKRGRGEKVRSNFFPKKEKSFLKNCL
jgi:hypothetical protein